MLLDFLPCTSSDYLGHGLVGIDGDDRDFAEVFGSGIAGTVTARDRRPGRLRPDDISMLPVRWINSPDLALTGGGLSTP